uniref:Uncharacterized protein n=1 Tax=Rhizophora mucronata TaxID=61149 RepID=A0A2P2NE54_RHIMU
MTKLNPLTLKVIKRERKQVSKKNKRYEGATT